MLFYVSFLPLSLTFIHSLFSLVAANSSISTLFFAVLLFADQTETFKNMSYREMYYVFFYETQGFHYFSQSFGRTLFGTV